jgi:hypothetical protein
MIRKFCNTCTEEMPLDTGFEVQLEFAEAAYSEYTKLGFESRHNKFHFDTLHCVMEWINENVAKLQDVAYKLEVLWRKVTFTDDGTTVVYGYKGRKELSNETYKTHMRMLK